ncbi:1-acyl-sn-glycerol-3-phosphate acyltransferase [Aequorivita lipolytica]|uniref:MMPL family transporter n=1 Tax=Aequorivita lipolytica TaxID=153267 RepID=A0A5C6YSU7_9FLAO|nr:1-acyl-sn-glycerol-3-phosphate acyltransferase [Aequorivita lipolytica]TXD70621.1 MMPL family transporter [Aequorivita lipolytica]SRX49654.1 Heme uptake protein MmpL11 [Aequorivita lipolytica]
MGNWFFKTHQFLLKNKIGSALLLLLVLLGLVFLVSKIRFEEDISKLIPINEDSQDLQKVLKTVNFTDKIIVNIHRSDSAEADNLTEYATEFLDSLEVNSGEYIKNIRGKVNEDDLQRTMNFVYENLPLFLDKQDYKIISGKLQKDSISAITETNYRTLISPSGIVSKEVILKDPLGLSFIALKKLRQLGVADDFILKDGFLVSKNEKNILLFISPKFASSETAENSDFAEKLYSLQNSLNQKYSGKVSSEYFGAALIAVANAQQIKSDIQFTVGIAMSLLILVFIFFYRKLYVPIILFVPTVFGGLLAVALLYLIRAEISAISLGIGSVLLGVTLDYSLHILTHIRNNETLESLYKDVTEPILMSSLTTALAFLCLLFLDSQALQDLGIFAAVSVLGASVFALFFIPLVYKNPLSRKQQINVLDKVADYPFHKNKWLLIGLAAVLVVSIFTYQKVEFNKDISKLNYEPAEIKAAMQHLDELTDISSKSVYLATYGKSVEGTLQLNDSIHETLQLLKEEGKISSFSSIGALVHSQKDQREKIAVWKQFWNETRKDSTKNSLIESGEIRGFKPTTFERFFTFLNKDFETLKPEDYQQIPSVLLEDYITTEADFTTITTLIKLEDDNASQIKDVFKEIPNTLVIDRQEMNETFLGNLKNDFNSLIGYCLIVVLLILFLFFRSFSLTLVTAVPIFLTFFLTLGIMGLFHIQFNIFNIIISTFIFGLGIDYSIFMTKGLLKELRTGQKVMVTHKTSIMLSVLTTILGVGVLVFAKHPALYSISIVSIIGIFSAMITAFTVQPLLFKLFIGSSKKRPITPRMFVHSLFSFGYFGLGGICLSLYSVTLMPLLPISRKIKMGWFHKVISKFMKSVLYTNPFVKKKVINETNEDFSKPAVIIANHTSFLDILAVGMLHPKICFLVNDWVYNSPVFGKAVQRADFYPVSSGIENSLEPLKKKIKQGYSLMAFPEGTRSESNKIKRFHKGAFYLANEFNLDILPVLIHGNSDVNPKGSPIIKDGSITVKILPRIKAEDNSLGKNHTQQAKQIGAYFKSEFVKLRDEMEGPKYFHRIVLEEYRYKGDALYRNVKTDLRENPESYFEIMRRADKRGNIVHISEDSGQLDFLLALDGPERQIFSFIEDVEMRTILQNSYITQTYGRLHFKDSVSETLPPSIETLIISSEKKVLELLEQLPNLSVKTIVLLKECVSSQTENISTLGYQNVYANTNISIFKQSGNPAK